MAAIIAPNFISVRLTDDDKRQFVAVQSHMKNLTGIELPMADVYRVALRALIEKHNLKVK